MTQLVVQDTSQHVLVNIKARLYTVTTNAQAIEFFKSEGFEYMPRPQSDGVRYWNFVRVYWSGEQLPNSFAIEPSFFDMEDYFEKSPSSEYWVKEAAAIGSSSKPASYLKHGSDILPGFIFIPYEGAAITFNYPLSNHLTLAFSYRTSLKKDADDTLIVHAATTPLKTFTDEQGNEIYEIHLRTPQLDKNPLLRFIAATHPQTGHKRLIAAWCLRPDIGPRFSLPAQLSCGACLITGETPFGRFDFT